MQEFADQHPALFFCLVFPTMWVLVGFLIALVGGWSQLAGRYRTEREFPQHKRWLQSAQMRFTIGYNSVLTLASDSEGLCMGVITPFRMGHPPLFIPWTAIQVEEPKRYMFFMSRMLRLGPDAIPLRLRQRTAQFLLEPRGAASVPVAGTISSSFSS